jgi:hypothetical protein
LAPSLLPIKFQIFWQDIKIRSDFQFRAEGKKVTSRAELKILQLELWLEPAWLGLITITYVLTSSHKAAPSLGCKVVVYSVNYNFCLNQISLNFYKINSEAAFPFSQSHTVVDACDIKKEVTLLYGLFLTLRCKLYQKGVKKS